MKIAIIAIGGIFLSILTVFASVFGQMIFVSEITDIKARKGGPYRVLAEGIEVNEIDHDRPPLEYEYQAGTGAMPSAAEVLLSPENHLSEGMRYFDSDPNRSVLRLQAAGDQPDKVFVDNDVYGITDLDGGDGQQLGEKIASFANPPLDVVRHIGALNHWYFVLIGDRLGSPYADPWLWLVNHATYEQMLLTKDPYFSQERPPKIFKPEGLDGTVLVYYVGELSWGYGGDSSRPHFSVVRLFSSAYPQGIDLARFAFKAGTVVEVEYRDGALILTGDPSVPRKGRRSPRLWQMNLPAKLILPSES